MGSLWRRGYASASRPEVINYVRRQIKDEYNKMARLHSYRARSAFKLLQLQERFHIVKPGDVVIDVGAAPGSWSQVLSELVCPDVKPNKGGGGGRAPPPAGYILAVDLQKIEPLPNVDLLCPADITRPATHLEIRRRLAGRALDAVLSDMAPNPTGNSSTDHYRIVALCSHLIQLMGPEAGEGEGEGEGPVLPMKNGARFLCKLWDGTELATLKRELERRFKAVKTCKPDASRDESAEIYLYAQGFRQQPL